MKIVPINVLFFGSLKQFFGEQIQLHVPDNSNLGDLLNTLKGKSPLASDVLGTCMIAVDNELQETNFVVKDSHEIAFLPPFSGG